MEVQMELRNLRALVTVAESGSVTRAAQLLHLAQSAVTRQIRSLEDELGVALFERTRQGMRPTEAGTVLVARTRLALGELERARAEIRPSEGHVTGLVTVGLLNSVEALLAAPLVEAITSTHPGIEIELVSAYSGHLQDALDAGSLDVSLLYNLGSTQSVSVVPVLRDDLWAVGPPDAGLTAERPVDLETVLGHPFVLPSSGRHGIRVLLDEAMSRRRLTPRTVARVSSMELQKQLVAAGTGWTVLPAPGVAAEVLRGELSAAPLADAEMSRTIAVGLRRLGAPSAATQLVAAELFDLLRTSVGEGRWPSARLVDGSGVPHASDDCR